MNYTERKVAFVSDLQGSSPWEILRVASVGPAALLLRNLLVPWLFPMKSFAQNCSKWDLCVKFLLDTFICVVPVLLSVTVASDPTRQVLLLGSLSAFIFGLLLVCCAERSYSDRKSPAIMDVITTKLDFLDSRAAFLTYTRAYLNIDTAMCILAVDFQAFPRRFAKTELYGYSLMDTGVGMFVAINALVSPEVQSHNRTLRKTIERTMYHISVLVALGLLRLVSVKASGYHEHVTEYGVHWNFFFTLAVIKVLSFPFVGVTQIRRFEGIFGIMLLIAHQYGLSIMGVRDIVLNGIDGTGSRNNLIDANREGLVSTVGYVSLHFMVAGIGRNIFRRGLTLKDKMSSVGELITLSAFVYALLRVSVGYVEEPSRRMANLAYVLWIVLFMGFHLILFILIEVLMVFLSLMKFPLFHWGNEMLSPFKILEPCLCSAVNYNPLLYFLLANIFTGVVNGMTDTVEHNDSVALLILSCYMAVLSATIYCLYLRRKRIA